MDAIPESAHIALTIQAVGIVLVTTLCCLLTRSIRRRFLDYWAISWGALTVSLSALLIAFCQPVPPRPFYTLYFSANTRSATSSLPAVEATSVGSH